MPKNITVYLLITCSLTSSVFLRGQTKNEENSQLLLEVKRLLQDIESERELDKYCASVLRDCVMTGDIFKKNVVCASNLKRYLNPCHLQIRSCDLKRETGEVLKEKRCLWINVDGEFGNNLSESEGTSTVAGDKSTTSGDKSNESGGESGSESIESEGTSTVSADKSTASGDKPKESGSKSKESGEKSKESKGKSKESGGKSKESGGKSKESRGKYKEPGGSSSKSRESSDVSKGKPRGRGRKPG